jgi:prophage antirepressor-like protein
MYMNCFVLSDEDATDAKKCRMLNPQAVGNQRKTQDAWMISEFGLYRFVLGSRKPVAKVFATWLFHDVLPELHKTGSYALPPAALEELKKQNAILQSELIASQNRYTEVVDSSKLEIEVLRQNMAKVSEEKKNSMNEVAPNMAGGSRSPQPIQIPPR